jgi:hypothetical protein
LSPRRRPAVSDGKVTKRKVGLLALNPEPLKLVPAGVRDVWTRWPRPYVCEFCGSTLARLEEDEITIEYDTPPALRGRKRNVLIYRCVDRQGCKRRQKEQGMGVRE